MFSPTYAHRLRRGRRTLPAEHPALHLALYKGGRHVTWVMSEYGAMGEPGDDAITIGGSSVRREGGGWRIDVVERASPWRQRVEGRITVEPLAEPFDEAHIASAGATHAWRVLAPRARVRAVFSRPDFSLDAVGYHDRNHGDGRLEDAFARWGWARFHEQRATTVVYSIVERGGEHHALVARAGDDEHGVFADTPAPEGARRRARWGLQVPVRFGAGGLHVEPQQLIEEAPFYARYLARLDARARLATGGGDAIGLGEYLDLDRFRHRGLQFLLRYKTRGGFRW